MPSDNQGDGMDSVRDSVSPIGYITINSKKIVLSVMFSDSDESVVCESVVVSGFESGEVVDWIQQQSGVSLPGYLRGCRLDALRVTVYSCSRWRSYYLDVSSKFEIADKPVAWSFKFGYVASNPSTLDIQASISFDVTVDGTVVPMAFGGEIQKEGSDWNIRADWQAIDKGVPIGALVSKALGVDIEGLPVLDQEITEAFLYRRLSDNSYCVSVGTQDLVLVALSLE
jgi:hypothetical protein